MRTAPGPPFSALKDWDARTETPPARGHRTRTPALVAHARPHRGAPAPPCPPARLRALRSRLVRDTAPGSRARSQQAIPSVGRRKARTSRAQDTSLDARDALPLHRHARRPVSAHNPLRAPGVVTLCAARRDTPRFWGYTRRQPPRHLPEHDARVKNPAMRGTPPGDHVVFPDATLHPAQSARTAARKTGNPTKVPERQARPSIQDCHPQSYPQVLWTTAGPE